MTNGIVFGTQHTSGAGSIPVQFRVSLQDNSGQTRQTMLRDSHDVDDELRAWFDSLAMDGQPKDEMREALVIADIIHARLQESRLPRPIAQSPLVGDTQPVFHQIYLRSRTDVLWSPLWSTAAAALFVFVIALFLGLGGARRGRAS